MKRNSKKLLCVLVGACLVLSACGPSETKPPESSGKKSLGSQSRQYNDSLIEELVFEDDFKDGGTEDTGIHYSYRLPQLKSKAPDAQELNDQLRSLAEDAESGEYLDYDRIDWHSCWNGSLLSLTVEMSVPYHGNAEYYMCNFDFAKQRFLDNDEVLARADWTPEDFNSAIRTAAAKNFDRRGADIWDMYEGCNEDLLDMRAQTISRENLNLEEMPIGLDENGQPCAAVSLATPAGDGSYAVLLQPDTQKNTATKSKTCEFVTAELNEDGVSLTFEKTDLAELFLPGKPVEYGRTYQVRGLYGTYTDMELCFMGNGGVMYLFLLDDAGMVTFCNIMQGVDNGMEFTAVGPLYWLKDVEHFATQSDMDGSSASVICTDGTEIDLYESIEKAEHQGHWMLENSAWCTDRGQNWMLVDDRDMSISWECMERTIASGSFAYGGMTEDGLNYGFNMVGDSSQMFGMLTLASGLPAREPDRDDLLTVHQAAGPLLPEFPDSGTIVLNRTFG